LKGYCKDIGRDPKEIQYSMVLPCLIRESEDEIDRIMMKYKRKDKSMEEYLEYLVGGVTIGTPEKIIKGLNEYVNEGVSHFIMHFLNLNVKSLELFQSQVIKNYRL
jgi:alkanesulfonate monooxygenase SsuD/methylene tetrahydromethanopterin reductase-like flavin-dependent oxidoreductase (luciferase family)